MLLVSTSVMGLNKDIKVVSKGIDVRCNDMIAGCAIRWNRSLIGFGFGFHDLDVAILTKLSYRESHLMRIYDDVVTNLTT